MRTFGLGLQLGMGNVVTRSASGGGGDPFSGYVVSLLHFDGVNGSTTHTDVMGIPWLVGTGGPTITTADSKFGGACASFDGADDYLGNTTNNPAFQFGSGEFCVELWVKFSDLSGFDAIHSRWLLLGASRSYIFGRNGSSLVMHLSSNGTATTQVVSSGTADVTTGVWYHVAYTRENNTSTGADTFRIFKDGVVVSTLDVPTGTVIHNPSASVHPTIGDNNVGTYDFTGFMDEMRVTKGVARYTGAFTPPTAPFPDPV